MPPENLFQVGEYIEMFNEVTGQDLPCGPIYQSHGLQAHVQKRHPSDISHLSCVPLIISAPDYIGKHPKEPNSIELVKVLERQCDGLYQARSVQPVLLCCQCVHHYRWKAEKPVE